MTEKSDKESRIIQAATKLFARYGIRKTTIDDIAQEAGIAKGTIYLYFKSKEEIIAVSVKESTKEILTRISGAADKESTIAGKLKAIALERINFHHEMRELLGISKEIHFEILTYMQLTPEVSKEALNYFQQEMKLVAQILQKGIDSGELEIPNIYIACYAFTTIVTVSGEPWIFVGGLLDPNEKPDAMIDLFLNGIRKR